MQWVLDSYESIYSNKVNVQQRHQGGYNQRRNADNGPYLSVITVIEKEDILEQDRYHHQRVSKSKAKNVHIDSCPQASDFHDGDHCKTIEEDQKNRFNHMNYQPNPDVI